MNLDFSFLTQQVPNGEKATYLDWILSGMGWSVATGFTAFAIALVIGIGIGVARSRPGATGKLANGIFEIVRSIPLMSMLFIAYYVVPAVFFPEAVKHVQFMTLIVIAGVLGLALFTSFRVSSHIYSSLTALAVGQQRAAQALGFSTWQSYRLVLLPQAIKQALPSLTNEFLSAVKNTSAISTIGLIELSRQTQNIIDNTSAIYEPFIVICTCYLIISGVALMLTRAIEKNGFTQPKLQKETI
ncbi:amino acid ABC transporter permease [Burkholderia stagnalis]|nr:amino acid ABC transporter permease [Burkholderia stagnalis]VWB05629.1 glutamate/aspartate ABC transporter permease GltJ [Burkholderia stagnalis]